MPPALDALRDRLAELADLTALKRLAAWDQRTMMPPNGAAVDDLQRDLVRFARRDWERARQVPPELAAELALAAAEGQAVWQTARAAGDFAAFAPALRRNVELARAYAGCFDDGAHPYDALLADYDFGLTSPPRRPARPGRRRSTYRSPRSAPRPTPCCAGSGSRPTAGASTSRRTRS